MIKQLLLGTGNKAKIDHYKKFLKNFPVEIVTAAELKISEPDESGKSLEENATLKAKYYHEKSGLPTLADDGGFEIPALDNFPGVFSHRFVGHKMSDAEVISEILKRMQSLKDGERKARFKVAVALAKSPNVIYTSTGSIEGHVPEKPFDKILSHFPYRSLLFVDKLNKWFYEVTELEEEQLGYRKAAILQLTKYF